MILQWLFAITKLVVGNDIAMVTSHHTLHFLNKNHHSLRYRAQSFLRFETSLKMFSHVSLAYSWSSSSRIFNHNLLKQQPSILFCRLFPRLSSVMLTLFYYSLLLDVMRTPSDIPHFHYCVLLAINHSGTLGPPELHGDIHGSVKIVHESFWKSGFMVIVSSYLDRADFASWDFTLCLISSCVPFPIDHVPGLLSISIDPFLTFYFSSFIFNSFFFNCLIRTLVHLSHHIFSLLYFSF